MGIDSEVWSGGGFVEWTARCQRKKSWLWAFDIQDEG